MPFFGSVNGTELIKQLTTPSERARPLERVAGYSGDRSPSGDSPYGRLRPRHRHMIQRRVDEPSAIGSFAGNKTNANSANARTNPRNDAPAQPNGRRSICL